MRDAQSIDATPTLVIDLSIVKRNVQKLAKYACKHEIGIRPHTKTHKSLRMARVQLDGGAIGLTAAKVGEAEVMAAAGRDLLIAFPAIDTHRCARIAELARTATVRVAIDSAEGATALAGAARQSASVVGVLVDIDVGLHRTGVQSAAESLTLAQEISRQSSLRLDGIFFYPGHVWSAAHEQAAELRPIDGLLVETIDLWSRSGLEARIVSGGSTPSAYQSHLLPSQTEIRPGTYIYNDMNTVKAGFCSLDDVAASLVCTVVSTAVPEKVVIDSGTKALTSDRNVTFPDSGHGHIVEYPQAKIVRLTEEHGEVDTSNCPRRPRLGERLRVIPNHICPCVNLQDRVWLRHDDGVMEELPVDARGKLV